MKIYAGVGSRETPPDILEIIQYAAEALADMGWVLRSGHAPGADQMFEAWAAGRAEIYLPWPTFEPQVPVAGACYDRPTGAAYRLAAEHHPAWEKLTRGAKALHARNSHQVLGRDLQTPVSFVLAWSNGNLFAGGTAQTVRIAQAHGIPCLHLGDGEVRWRVERMIEHQRALDA